MSPTSQDPTGVAELVDHLFRRQAGRMVATLTRIFGVGHLDLVEDVVQDALLKALKQWPFHGVPGNPSAWIVQVAKHRALDALRRRGNWGRKEVELRRSLDAHADQQVVGFAREVQDDQLQMILVCCHPVLSRDAQTALTLKAVSGLGVGEIASALLAKPATVAQRLVRAKRALRRAEVRFEMPPADQLSSRLDSVLEVLYLTFNEGYSASSGDSLVRRDLCAEAIRLVLLVADHPVIGSTKVDALAALFHFQASRLATRVDAEGDLLLLEAQDRSRWDRSMIHRGALLLARSGRGEELSAYHLQAEIAACHALAADFGSTDWSRILECYDTLRLLDASPVVEVGRLVALSQVEGAGAALIESDRLMAGSALAAYYPAFVVRAELLAALERPQEADACLREAENHAAAGPVRRFLAGRRRALAAPGAS